jgi:hypothetical protein
MSLHEVPDQRDRVIGAAAVSHDKINNITAILAQETYQAGLDIFLFVENRNDYTYCRVCRLALIGTH